MIREDLRADKADVTDSTIAPDVDPGGGSRIAIRDGRVGDQQLPASNTSIPTSGHDGGDLAGECGRL